MLCPAQECAWNFPTNGLVAWAPNGLRTLRHHHGRHKQQRCCGNAFLTFCSGERPATRVRPPDCPWCLLTDQRCPPCTLHPSSL
ncbi:uncharacterized protein ACOB8E_006262 [Sarcophilus harrisii]